MYHLQNEAGEVYCYYGNKNLAEGLLRSLGG